MVCRTKPVERAKQGQKDYFLSVRVVDSSLPLGITASVFRPYKDALPEVEMGDCMLFRNFKVLFLFYFYLFFYLFLGGLGS